MQRLLIVLSVAFAVLISCSQMPDTQYFTLEYDISAQPETVTDLPVYIEAFDANPLLDQDRMIYKTSQYELKLDHYRRWVMSPNGLVERKLNDYFHERGVFAYVVHQVPRDRQCYYLSGHVQSFEEVAYGPQRQAHIAIWFELMHMQTRDVLMSQLFEESVPITGDTADAIAAAMSQATLSLFDNLADRLQAELRTP